MDIVKVKYIDSERWVVDANDLNPDGFDQRAGFVYPPSNISCKYIFPELQRAASR